MCGISGIITKRENFSSLHNYNTFQKKISHRGPDNFGEIEISNQNFNLILSHYRLSIQGLGEMGNQPWIHDNLIILFNGEIYNYTYLKNILLRDKIKLETNCDTELIPHLFIKYGKSFVEYLNGMFSIVIFDKKSNKVLLFRDYFGVKPLYYLFYKNSFYFSSEINSFKSLNLEINSNSLYSYLIGSYNIFVESFFKNVFELPKGSMLEIDLGNSDMNSSLLTNFIPYSNQNMKLHLTEYLFNSIKEQLISDVPIGISLSGGLDSAIILNYARQNKIELTGFTVNYKFNHNDVEKAKILAKKYNIKLVIINVFDDFSNYFELLEEVYENISEPIADTAFIGNYLVCKYAKKEGIKVILSGAGGDEIFGGYDRYIKSYKYYLKNLFSYLPNIFFKKKSLINLKLKNKYFDNFTNTSGCFIELNKLIKLPFNSFYNYFNILPNNNNFIDIINYDLNNYLSKDILKISDLSSMLNSIEVRVPLLDYNLLTFVRKNFILTDYIKYKKTKNYLRNQMTGILPPEVIDMNKLGFGAPINFIIENSKVEIINYLKKYKFQSISELNDLKFNNCSNNLLLHLYILIKWEKSIFQ